jgi:hypothetical protein
MLWALGAASFALIFPISVTAQALPAGRQSVTRWLFTFETGSKSGLGYKLPHVLTGVSFEQPIGQRIELQGGVSYSPDRTYVTNNGNSLTLSSSLLYWVSNRVAVTGSMDKSYLWTSLYTKSAVRPDVGIAIREFYGDVPGRVYLSYLLPTGCQWGASCRIQSDRMQGPQFYWEYRLWPRFRLGINLAVCRILNPSNPMEPSIPRSHEWTGYSLGFVKFEVPAGAVDSTF